MTHETTIRSNGDDPRGDDPRGGDPHGESRDDPRLTAYALGELPPGDWAEIDALLARDPAARAFVEETRAFASLLETEMADASAAAPALDESARTAVRDAARSATSAGAAAPVPRPRGKVLRVARWAIPASLSAAILSAPWLVGGQGETEWARGVVSPGWGPSSNAQFGAAPAGESYDHPSLTISKGGMLRLRTAPGDGNAPGVGAAIAADVEASKLQAMGYIGGTGGPSSRPASGAFARGFYGTRGGGDGGRWMGQPPRPGSYSGMYGGAGGVSYVRAEDPNGGPAGVPKAGSPTSVAGRGAPGGAQATLGSDFSAGVTTGGGGGPQPAQTPAVGFDDIFFGSAGGSAPAPAPAMLRLPGYLADFDVEIAQAAAIGDPLTQRGALVALVRRVEAARGGEAAGFVLDVALQRIGASGRSVEGSRESYASLDDNPFRTSLDSPLSTFGIDVDTASYANVRRILRQGQLPPPGAVRVEEMLNYFPYRYDAPADGSPFAVHTEVARCPWEPRHRLVRVGIKGREADLRERPAANLVFLVDVSGSMSDANKLPLLVQSMKQLVPLLEARDRVSIVVYAGSEGLALPPTPGDRHAEITGALDRLSAGGSTNGGAGIGLAYKIAAENFVAGGINRVVLATDGDFNVGVTDDSSLVRLIEEKAKSKVFLTVLGFGEGNLQDAKMEALADKGNGNYAYVDSLREGRKVLVEQAAGTLMTLAKDVKLQIEFNPLRVASYRLIGYENRVLATEDFANDRKDAGDLGAGHTVTALYEIVPAAQTETAGAPIEPLRYQTGVQPTDAARSAELMTVKLRWKLPEGDVSTLREFTATDSTAGFDQASPDLHFQAGVAAFGMLLRGSPHRGAASLAMVEELAMSGLGFDPGGHRAEFVDLVRAAKAIGR